MTRFAMRRLRDRYPLHPVDERISIAVRTPDAAPAETDAPSPAVGGAALYLERIPVRSMNRIVIVPVSGIVRLEAEDNYVRIWADRPYLHKETLTGLMLRLDPVEFLRVHRSHAVNIRLVRELRPQLHGEYVIALANGTELTSGRSYRGRIQEAFGLSRIAGDE